MLKTNLLLLVALWGFGGVLSQTIDATGGGVVKLSDELKLSTKGDKAWKTCTWKLKNTKTVCNIKKGAGSALVVNCIGSLNARVSTPTIEDPTVCAFNIKVTKEEDAGTWDATLDDNTPVSIDVVIALEVKSVKAEDANLVEGKPSFLKCVVSGGKPAPSISFKYKPENHPGLKEVTGTVTSKVDLSQNTVYSMEVIANRSVDALTFNCQASQFDKKKVSLYKPMNSNDASIIVKYGPTLIHGTNKTLITGVKLNNDNSFQFAIEAYPKPDVELSITDSKNSKNVLKLKPGNKDGSYTLGPLEKASDGDYYTLTFTISKLKQEDVHKVYYLKITNSISELNQQFNISVGGSPAHPTLTRTIVIIVVVAVVVALVLLCACFLLIKKFKSRSNETTPLR